MNAAQAFLDEIRSLGKSDPKGAMRLLERKSPALREAFGVGGPMHEQFSTLVADLRTQLDSRGAHTTAPTVAVISWEEVPDLEALVRAAQRKDAEIIYLAAADRRKDAPPLAQLDALDEFANPKAALVVVGGGPPILIRRSLLLSASASLNPRTDIADVGQDLLEFAERSGHAARFIR